MTDGRDKALEAVAEAVREELRCLVHLHDELIGRLEGDARVKFFGVVGRAIDRLSGVLTAVDECTQNEARPRHPMNALRECPLCKSADVIVVTGAVEFTDAEVQCKECGAQTGNYHGGTVNENKADATAAWNTRAGDEEIAALKAEVEKLRSAAAYQAEAHTLRTGIKLHTERLRAMGYTNRKQESNLQMIGRAMDEIATLRAELAAAREALKDARLQLEYLDSRWPTGTTPTILTRISVALGNQK